MYASSRTTFSSVSSMASSLSFSLPPFFSRLSQNVASSSALVEPATPLLQNTSNASLSARWNRLSLEKHSLTYCKYLSCSSMTLRTNTCSVVVAAAATAAASTTLMPLLPGPPAPLAAPALASFLPVAVSSACLTSATPSFSTCFLKMSATGGSPPVMRLNSRNMRPRSSVLSSRSSTAHPLCSFSSSCISYAASTSFSTSFSSLDSDDACR
mmetsp:Transcript_25338/g.62514  ORF Transcript_25338/g.62514 Transcript_25338/m.62514 type:complete len:212 (-) Transcript_25338:986-1621(-)